MNPVLLVEDDDRLRRALAVTLRSRGYGVYDAATGTDGLRLLAAERVDIMILDLGLPDIDGLEVLRRAREDSNVPVLVLSARRDQADKVQALDAGADDYLTKPFGVDELMARLRAAVRRSGRSFEKRVIVTPDFSVNLGLKSVSSAEGRSIRLTPTEWSLLEVLVGANGLVVPGAELLARVWGPKFRNRTNYLRVYLAQLRQKLEPSPSNPRYLITSPGLGYRFDPTGTSGRP